MVTGILSPALPVGAVLSARMAAGVGKPEMNACLSFAPVAGDGQETLREA